MPQTALGPYRLETPIARGGQGSVWSATDTRDGRRVAVKILHDDAGAVELARFRREAALLSTLSDPGLPRGLQLIEDGPTGVRGLVMQWVDGRSLGKLVRAHKFAPWHTLMVTKELSRVTALLHDRGIVHRDIKGSNVLLRAGSEQGIAGSVVLVDLGIARGIRKHGTACTEIGMALGSLPYMAPEVIAGTGEPPLRPTNDVFGIGVLAWLMLFQSHPCGLPMQSDAMDFVRAYLYGTPSYPEAEAEAVHRLIPGLIPVLARAVDFAPERRFPDARELYRALVQVELRCADDGDIHTEVHPLGPMVSRPSLVQSPASLPGPTASSIPEQPSASRESRVEVSYRESFVSSLPMSVQQPEVPIQQTPRPETVVSTTPPARSKSSPWLAVVAGVFVFVLVVVAAVAWRWMGR